MSNTRDSKFPQRTRSAETLEKAKHNLQVKAFRFAKLFSSMDGKTVLDDLRKEFDRDSLCVVDPHSTVIYAAQRDVIRYIELMLLRAAKLENQDDANE